MGHLTLPYRIILLFLCCILFSCTDKQIQKKAILPEKGKIILISGKLNPDDYTDKMEVFMIDPNGEKISILDTREVTDTSKLNSFVLSYKELLFFKDNSKYFFVPEELKDNYRRNYILHPLPVFNSTRDKILFPWHSGFGVYDSAGKIIKGFELNPKSFGWLNKKILYLDGDKKNETNSVYSLEVNETKKDLIYKSDKLINSFAVSPDELELATIEYSSNWDPIEYSVRIINIATGKIISTIKMPNYIKKVKWSSKGELAILFRMKNIENILPPFSIHIVSKRESYDLLNLPAYERPGFIFSGKGYTGVMDFAWDPDGNQIAYIASEPGNCNSDEGDNVHCSLDVFKIDISSRKIQKITNIKNQSLQLIEWNKIRN